MMQSSFMPINEPNFDSTYVLDFGDILEIQLIGQKSSIEQLLLKEMALSIFRHRKDICFRFILRNLQLNLLNPKLAVHI